MLVNVKPAALANICMVMSTEAPLVETDAVTYSLVLAQVTNSASVLWGELAGTVMMTEWMESRGPTSKSLKTS